MYCVCRWKAASRFRARNDAKCTGGLAVETAKVLVLGAKLKANDASSDVFLLSYLFKISRTGSYIYSSVHKRCKCTMQLAT